MARASENPIGAAGERPNASRKPGTAVVPGSIVAFFCIGVIVRQWLFP
jgi:hypothetical protein